MNYQNILLELEAPIAILKINRPQQLNALNKATIEELNQVLQELRDMVEIRAIILTGEGAKAFVAGADIKEFSDFGVNEGTELAAIGQESLFDYIENFNKPIIAAVNGFALGGGLELAMSCHFRVAAGNAKMGLPEVTLGLIPGYGGTQRLAQLVGKGHAMEMITTAEMITANKAMELGLVNEVVEHDELLDYCRGKALRISRNSSTAVESAIKAVNAGFKEGVSGFKVEIEEFGKCFGTADFVEGTQAFMEKRKPQF
ncbi:MAG: enoyl-CoA hydratase [Bacteroidetes bacterium]|nr:MAG: enoyl-CoA hydratase [Bacteroidota bacterium]